MYLNTDFRSKTPAMYVKGIPAWVCLLLWCSQLTIVSSAGVAAEGSPVLGHLIGPAQEREAIMRREGMQPHHLRHQHHREYFGDPRLRGRPPPPGSPMMGMPLDTAPPPASASPMTSKNSTGSCLVSPEQLASAAQDTASRLLEGICNPKEMEDRFHNLEAQLADQFNVLKTMILNLEDKVGAMDIGMERAERRILSAISRSRCSRGSGDSEGFGTDEEVPSQDEDSDEDLDPNQDPAFVTLHRDGSHGPGAREDEILRFNNTVHTEYVLPGQPPSNTAAGCGAGRRVFTYYWKIRNMDYKLTGWNQRRSLRSPSFYVWPGGYRMYLRMYPRQAGENVYVHVGLTKGDYDNALQWPFRLKHRLGVLDQVGTLDSPMGAQDLVSRLWDPSQLCSPYNWQKPSSLTPDNYECVGLGFPQGTLRTRDYIREDAVIVRLTVCLEH